MRLLIEIPYANNNQNSVLDISYQIEGLVKKHGGKFFSGGSSYGFRDLEFEIEDYSICTLIQRFLIDNKIKGFYCEVH